MIVPSRSRKRIFGVLICHRSFSSNKINPQMIEVLKLMIPYLRPFWKQALVAIILAIPLAALKAYEAYLVKDIFDKGFSPNSTSDQAWMLAGLLILLALINYPLRYFHFYILRSIVDQTTCMIREKLFFHFQKMPMAYFSQKKQGHFISVLMSDTMVFADAFKNALEIIREPLTASFLLGVAIYHDWQLALVVFLVAPLFIIIFNRTGRRVRKYVSMAQEDTAQMTHSVSEALIGHKIIKAFNLKDYMVLRFHNIQRVFLQHRQKSNSAEEHSHPMVEFVGSLAFAIVIVFAHHRITTGALTTGGFVSFIAALAMFMDPVRKFTKANAKLNQARAASQRIMELMNVPMEVDTGTQSIQSFKNKIEFKKVSFSYGDGYVLKNFNLVIEKGQKVGLVGLSGSGKSTLVSLLLRLYPVTDGEILIDGVNIQDYKLDELRNIFGLVSQDIFLFNDTVKENLTTGQDFTEAQINNALEVSYADEYIKDLPQGVLTGIGDRGLRLSGGQAQRLTIARAFLKNREVLLFDEATSALDNESEKIVQAALERVAGHKTVIAIAHRLSTLKHFDRIVVMKEGQKIEEGQHDELMRLQGEYHKLYLLSQSS
jgi:subfamily B ATP-binding cassette protein MsbA